MALVRAHNPGPATRQALHRSRCGAMVGAIFWSLLVQLLSLHTSVVWSQRGLMLVSIVCFACCCGFAPGGSPCCHSYQQDNGDDEEPPRPPTRESRGLLLTALADCALLLAFFLIYAGVSMTCTFVTPLALRAGVAPATAGFAQVGMYSTGLAGHLIVGAIEHAVSRLTTLVAGSGYWW
ncbi:hypothetical protein PWT90_08721 [Aphanocladium album]|nr:hypothetical protein PWT90_08721 [Aphanocladium album]